MAKLIIVKADTNDADYVEATTVITDEELELILPVIEAIKNFEPYKKKGWHHDNNYPVGDVHRDDLGEKSAYQLYGHLEGFQLFDEDFVPSGEYGIHTIVSINILEVSSYQNLLGSGVSGLSKEKIE